MCFHCHKEQQCSLLLRLPLILIFTSKSNLTRAPTFQSKVKTKMWPQFGDHYKFKTYQKVEVLGCIFLPPFQFSSSAYQVCCEIQIEFLMNERLKDASSKVWWNSMMLSFFHKWNEYPNKLHFIDGLTVSKGRNVK